MATARNAPAALGDSACPGCGALASQGGCPNPEKCVAELSCMEGDRIHQLVNALAARSAVPAVRPLAIALGALDLLNIGLIVCSASGTLLSANAIADSILNSRDGLELDENGALVAPLGSSQSLEQIFHKLTCASEGERAEPESCALSVRRAPGKRALTLFVRSASDHATENAGRAVVLVLILNGGLHVRTTDWDLRQLYGFTSREARLATLLMDGNTLDESCYELGITRSTGCTHLRRLFKKTGVRRQSELAALLLKSVGLVRLASDANCIDSGSSALNSEDELGGALQADVFSPSLPA